MNRRRFFKVLSVIGISARLSRGAYGIGPHAKLLTRPYHPGRIENEYSVLLEGEREALSTLPKIMRISGNVVAANQGQKEDQLKVGQSIDGWVLINIGEMNGVSTAVFEKHVTHRGVIAYTTERGGTIALIPKYVGDLSKIRPRLTNTPHGVKFERPEKVMPGPDIPGDYILRSEEDPCYENVAALGPEYIGWSLVANEQAGPFHSVYLEPDGRSHQRKASVEKEWIPFGGALFDPEDFFPWRNPDKYAYETGFSKRTLLGGFLPIADIGVWNQAAQCGYEVMMLLPPGNQAEPMARIRLLVSQSDLEVLVEGFELMQEPDGKIFAEYYWNCSRQAFFRELAGIWNHWSDLYDSAMPVEIPDEWLLNAARAGITLARCSYRGLEPSYQVGEGGYTKIPERSHAIFPVAHYEFIWAQQIWNLTGSSNEYFQHYLEQYITSDGNFLYNTEDQVEAPLNVGIFLMNSARSYLYTRDVESFAKRLPILERMITFVLKRYEYSKHSYPSTDRRYGLIWGSPEADLGEPHNDYPNSHPLYFQNSTCVWRGLVEHARALKAAGSSSSNQHFLDLSDRYSSLTKEMRTNIQGSIEATIAACNSEMRQSGITPFEPNDIVRHPTELSSYENHRFMMDWFLADWGVPDLDLGHLKHRLIAGQQICGLSTDGDIPRTSNFMEHGTLSVRIRQEDYRPYLLTLYSLVCYAADCGNRYSPEDAYIPGGHPGESSAWGWSAVVNSVLQPTLGLRWLLCYEEDDRDICHLQKAAPKHWFDKGERISVRNCPTRFGVISWLTEAIDTHMWRTNIDLPKGFSGDIVLHIHPPDDLPLGRATEGTLTANHVVLTRELLSTAEHHEIEISQRASGAGG
jgi:hypothetical protein